MNGSVLIHATDSRLAITRFTRHQSGLDTPSGEFDIVMMPCPAAVVGERTRNMLALPRVENADDAAATRLKYREVALALGEPATDLLELTPYLLASALTTRIEVSRVARRSARAKPRISAVADLTLDISDEELGRVVLGELAST